MTTDSNGGEMPTTPSVPNKFGTSAADKANVPNYAFLRWLALHQFRINCLASVAIERPALRLFLPEDA